MTVKNLSNLDFDDILHCFLQAFENYFVKMPTDRSYFEKRWEAAKVDFSLSYGMFDKEKLVGFVIHGIDTRNGNLTAFNTGTGVIPAYRGQKIVKSIYDYAFEDLRRNGVENCSLEVITKNEVAIQTYKSIGFRISKNYKCFNGTIKLEGADKVALEEIDFGDVDWLTLPNQAYYSWDFQKESIQNSNYKFFQVFNDKEPESFFVINPSIGLLAQFDLLKENKHGWQRLFSGIRQVSETIRVLNIDERLSYKSEILKAIGLDNTIDQYEMELKIKEVGS